MIPLALASLADARAASQGSNPVEMERPSSLLPACFGEGKFDVYDLHPMEVRPSLSLSVIPFFLRISAPCFMVQTARQSTIVALNLYRRITMRELLFWNSPDQDVRLCVCGAVSPLSNVI